MKARFTEKQDPVTWNALPDGNVDVMICLNEKTVTEICRAGRTDRNVERLPAGNERTGLCVEI